MVFEEATLDVSELIQLAEAKGAQNMRDALVAAMESEKFDLSDLQEIAIRDFMHKFLEECGYYG